MKVGILTFHRASNFGAVLQNYALVNYLNRIGCQCETIDYRSKYLERYYQAFTVRSFKPKKIIGALLNAPIRKIRKMKYDNFRDTYIPLSKSVTEKTIHMISDTYDLYIFGSDQVWNASLTGSDMNYLGEFVDDSTKLVSYAASFGKTSIPESLKKQYHDLLSRFHDVSVREESASVLYETLTSQKAKVVLDPVFLLTREEWSELLKRKKNNGKYILVYHLKGKLTKVNQYAEYLAKKTGLPIIDMQGWVKKYPVNVSPRYWDSPNDFLDWIENAEYILTDSFHCTAFSIIFQKNFWSFPEPEVDKYATRVGNLLKKLSLTDRIVPSDFEDWNYENEIQYSDIEKKLNKEIELSKNYITKVVNL